MLATCMFHQYTVTLQVSAQQYWISFKATAHCRELEAHLTCVNN